MKTLLFFLLSLLYTSVFSQDKFVLKGDEKMKEGDFESAIKLYSKSIDKDKSTIAFNQRALAYTHLGEKAKAINDYSYSLEIDHNQTNIWVSRGKMYLKGGQYSNAESDFSTALDLDNKNKEALVERGETYSKQHHTELACEDWAKAASLGDKRGQALLKIKCTDTVELSTDYMQERIRK